VLSDEVKEGEYEYPHKVDKVPIKTYFLYHFVVLSSLEYPSVCHNKYDEVYYNSRENVESVESSNKEEEIRVALL
jgi:hypothetical protein